MKNVWSFTVTMFKMHIDLGKYGCDCIEQWFLNFLELDLLKNNTVSGATKHYEAFF